MRVVIRGSAERHFHNKYYGKDDEQALIVNCDEVKYRHIARSANGRQADSESVNLGSNPSWATDLEWTTILHPRARRWRSPGALNIPGFCNLQSVGGSAK